MTMLAGGTELPPTRDSLRDQIHVWTARPAEFRDATALARYRSWLSDEERARADRYLDAEDRHLFLVAHALLRSTLSRYGGCPPEAWRFATGEFGRPWIADEVAGTRRLGFGLSHTRGMVACVVSEEIECGVDVEGLGRVADPRGLARRYFHRRECEDLDRLSDPNVDARFIAYWTLKEAYLKARGLGLELPLDGFHFLLGGDAPITVAFDAAISDRTEHWQFDQWPAAPGHVIAIASRRRFGRLRDVIQREVRPGAP